MNARALSFAALMLLFACSPETSNRLGGLACMSLLADQGIDPFYLSREEISVNPTLGDVIWYCAFTEDAAEADAACPYDDAAIIEFTDEARVRYFAHFAASPIAPVGEIFCILPRPRRLD